MTDTSTPVPTEPTGDTPPTGTPVVATIPLSGAFQTYAAALLPFLVLVLGALPAVQASPHAVTVIPFAILVVGNVATYLVPLLPSGWRGAFKVGAPIVTTILGAVFVYAQDGTLTWANSTVIVVGVLSALATQFGVIVRAKSQVALAA